MVELGISNSINLTLNYQILTFCYIALSRTNTLGQNIDFEIRRNHEKKFYERCVYESVGDKSQFWDTSQKSMENKIHAEKG